VSTGRGVASTPRPPRSGLLGDTEPADLLAATRSTASGRSRRPGEVTVTASLSSVVPRIGVPDRTSAALEARTRLPERPTRQPACCRSRREPWWPPCREEHPVLATLRRLRSGPGTGPAASPWTGPGAS
jgi:hypothetical protein